MISESDARLRHEVRRTDPRRIALAVIFWAVLALLAMHPGRASASSFGPGSVVLTGKQSEQVCKTAAGAGQLPNAQGGTTITSDGRLILLCGDSELVAYDLAGGYVAWQMSATGYVAYSIGDQHMFAISESHSSASGLQGASNSYTLTAIDITTGATDWTVPYVLPAGAQKPSTDAFNVEEGPSGDPAHPTEAVVDYAGTSAFDDSTGALLGQSTVYAGASPDLQGNGYVGYGVDLASAMTNDPSDRVYADTATSVTTGGRLWQETVPPITSCGGDQSVDSTASQGEDVWIFWTCGYEERNILTGALVADASFPSGWRNELSYTVSPANALYADDSHLSYYSLSNLSAPLWSVPANSVTPIAMGSSYALISADSGAVLVSLKDGSIAAQPKGLQLSNVPSTTPVADGYWDQVAADGDVTVVEIDSPTVTIPQKTTSSKSKRRSPDLNWVKVAKKGGRGFVIKATRASGATGSVTFRAKLGGRIYVHACHASGRSITCTVQLLKRGSWTAWLYYSAHTSRFRSTLSKPHIIRVR